ncbi:putative disease resistance protein [Camellia lanceoleosa]|uniref:Disease resistance protein n=1 Tax=Camellia lanceoleosa TaxID=1840588 RepID=A0ACC0IK89_9ERIC|nr:putative disease resistance protein [Camellia lanceoleosa]
MVHNWVVEIREAAYDAEDVIDMYIIKVAFRRRTGILNVFMRFSCVIKDCIAIHKVGVEIESIKTKISSITTSLQKYGVSSSEGESSSSTTKAISEGASSSSSRYETQRLLRQSYPQIMEEDIVGLDKDLTEIVEHLVKEERQCRVVSIWEMGGIGKTTLAKKVYHHNDVRCHFDCFAWPFISQQCNVREVLEEILIGLTSPSLDERKKIKIMKHGELVEELFQVQSQKKCLVAIDDIWKAQDWEIFSPTFSNKKDASSKILLTTRIKEVASNADQPRELRTLTENESWELFGKKAFLRRNVTVPPAQVGEMKVEETMLDVGMSYLSELAQTCMVQVQLTRFNRRIKLCHLHDLMRDLCLLKAQEENFLKVVHVEHVEAFDNQQLKWEDSASSSSSSPLTKIRRLAMYYLGDHDANNTRQEYINLEELTNLHHLWSCQFYFFGKKLKSSG